ncbi:MAG: nucleotide exchange factor GrpE [Mycoplasmataceae bacterium]|jgi:molecular chaperone GrpE|nr:nucleotide exchange factor GrpE [Mycoplasmataceae bacterium]
MSKHNHKTQPDDIKESKVDENHKVEVNNEQPNEVKATEVDKLEQAINEIKKLQELVQTKDDHINKLQEEINKINHDYITKITEKTNEANATLKAKIDELTNKANQELTIHKKYALEKQATALIDIINQFSLALDYKPSDPNIAKYQSGFQMFLVMFKNLLVELGINEIPVNIGDEFNPEIMECIEFVHSNELSDNKVARIITKGYKLHDRLIKPIAVNIVRKKS